MQTPDQSGSGEPARRVTASESKTPTYYSDSAQLSVTLFSFCFGFHLRRVDSSVQPQCEVQMSPQHAKVLSIILAKHVAAYESTVGEIVIPKGAVKSLEDEAS